jgi:anti-sigma28 factor (negative regulator of flagellin synthesis)
MKITGNDIDRIYNPVMPEKNTVERKNERKSDIIIDRVDLSAKAKTYTHEKSIVRTAMNDSLKQTSSKKLLQLRDDISNGRYHVSSEEIAAAILYRNKNQE